MRFLLSQARLEFMRVSPVEKKDICSGFVRNVGTSSRVFATTEGTRRKLGIGRIWGEFSRD